MIELLLFILICWGMTQILAIGRVFNAIRPDYYLFKCPMCVGFWVGAVVSWLEFGITGGMSIFMYGCISSGTSYALVKTFGTHGINIARARQQRENQPPADNIYIKAAKYMSKHKRKHRC